MNPCRTLLLSSLAAALGACSAVGPDYHPPRTAAPATWAQWHAGDAALAPTDAAGAPLAAPLVDAADDPVLRELLRRAERGSPDLATAALHVAEARQATRVVAAAGGPQVAATAAVQRQRVSADGAETRVAGAFGGGAQKEALVGFLSTPFTVYDAGFDASWELDLWGRVRRGVEAARAREDAQRAWLSQMRLVVRGEALRGYFDLRSRQAQLAAMRDAQAAGHALLALVAVQVRDGLVDESARLQAADSAAALDARVDQLQAAVASDLDRLTLLCGEHPGAFDAWLAAPAVDWQTWRPLPARVPGPPGEFLRQRPDVQAAERRLAAATADIGVAVADLYPRVSLGASVGSQSVAGDEFGQWASRRWAIGPMLSVPVFDQGRLRGTVVLRQRAQQEAAVAFQQAVLQAWHEAEGGLTAYADARRQFALADARRRDAEAGWRLAQARQRRGLTDQSAALRAQLARDEARRAEAEASGHAWQAAAALEKALGR